MQGSNQHKSLHSGCILQVVCQVHFGHLFILNIECFRGERLAKAQGHSIQQAEMNAAKLALETCSHLFPHLNYQRRIMERSFKRQGVITETIRDTWYKETLKKRQELGLDAPDDNKEVKQEVEEEKPTIIEKKAHSADKTAPPTVVVSPVEPEPSKHDHQLPSVSGIKKLVAPSTSQTKDSTNAVVPKKKDNKDAVRAEIKEIEEKLKKKKQKKLAAKAADLEDGECDDSDDDENNGNVATAPIVTAPLQPTPTAPSIPNISEKQKQRDDNRKRWNEGRRSSTHGGDYSYRDSREGSHSRDRERDRRHDRRDDRNRYHDRHYRN